jgi:V8-like Glu-specific endopeptidase
MQQRHAIATPRSCTRQRQALAVFAAAGFAVASLASSAQAQTDPEISQSIALRIDSGIVQNAALGGPIGADPSVVYRTEVQIPEAPWLRLTSINATLAGDPEMGTGSYLVITSTEDGARQRLDAVHLEYWNNTSAYFNGHTVVVELWAYPGTGVNRLAIDQVTFGDPNQQESICGTVDDRTPFSDPRVAHLRPVGCTAWIAGHGLSANRFLTAGHCISGTTSNAVVMFNMPLSTSTGGWRSPPPEYQYPVQQTSIQSTNTGIGGDYATFQTFPNSNTGMGPRTAMRQAFTLAGSAPNVASPAQTIRITGHGARDGAVTTPIPQEWNSIGKTHTGNYVSKAGTTIRYAVDTTGGNSGSPVILESNGSAIGIHTNAGCTSTGGSNQGTAIEQAGLQAFLSNPLGTSIPFSTPPGLSTVFGANNQGSAGGTVFFDVVVGSAPLDVWGLDLNIRNNATPGGTYDVDVYLTPQGRAGKETNQSAWTRVARGRGIVNPRDSVSRVVLPAPFRLAQGVRYGVAIHLNGDDAGHAYTDGSNNYSNLDLTIETGSASNTFFGSNFADRSWNGRLVYARQPVVGQCHESFYASNNGGSTGGAVYFDVDIFDVSTVRITDVKLNTSAAAGTPLTLNIYRRAGTSVGNHTSTGWVQVGTASGISAGLDLATTMTLATPFYLAGNSSQGIALVLNGGGHQYTNGTGFNEVSWNAAMRISDGSASNVPFAGAAFTPRVFNGGFCYILGTGGCSSGSRQFAQSPPDPTLESRNSNVFEQQIADDFTGPSGFNTNISSIKTWAVYTGTNEVPQTQNFTVTVYSHDASTNNPGAQVYTRNISNVTPVRTGHAQTGFTPSRDLFEFNIPLGVAFAAQPGTRYWVSIMGNSVGNLWSWQFASNSGERRSRGSGTGSWGTFTGTMAMEFCGTQTVASCYANCDNSTVPPVLNVDDFTCFINQYAMAQGLSHAQQVVHYANCDGSTIAPVLNVDDFTCFINRYALGCP